MSVLEVNASSLSGGLDMNDWVEPSQLKFDRDQARVDSDLRNLNENREGLEKAAGAFEGIFLSMLFKQMRESVETDEGIMPPSPGMKMFQGLMDDEVAKQMESRGALGLAKMVVRAYESNVPLGKE